MDLQDSALVSSQWDHVMLVLIARYRGNKCDSIGVWTYGCLASR